ncbi:MAG: RIP metalloprotease RseP [Bacteroidales bacterium]|nr:RIP metalloprotease RseP [Bacteroidales bacterium]
MDVLIQIGQLILALSILVILHEFGHFFFARVFKTRVEKFYLFFNPWFSLFKIKRGDTEYGVGWLPLGGYVKISGMIDESMDKEQLNKPPQPYEFRSKKAYQRLLIMVGGVLVNLLLGVVIYTSVIFVWGQKFLPVENMNGGLWVVDSLAYDVGLRNGDKIISVNDNKPAVFEDLLEEMLYPGNMIVDRGGEQVTLTIPEDFPGQLIDKMRKKEGLFLYVRMPFVISKIPDTTLNAKSGLKLLDRVVAINNIPIKFHDEFTSIADTMANKDAILTVIRDESEVKIDVKFNENGKIEVVPAMMTLGEMERLGYLELETKEYTFLQSIPAGFNLAKTKLQKYIRQFKLIFNFKTGAYKGVGGFAAITKLFPSQWNWQVFWELTAFLSLMLAFLNILPIPALDGGHVTFLLYEMVTGRKPGDKFLEYAQIVGMILLLSLLLYANGNDIYQGISRLIGK